MTDASLKTGEVFPPTEVVPQPGDGDVLFTRTNLPILVQMETKKTDPQHFRAGKANMKIHEDMEAFQFQTCDCHQSTRTIGCVGGRETNRSDVGVEFYIGVQLQKAVVVV